MLIKRFVILFFTMLLLFTDSGQMLYAHTCLKTNHTHYSISSPKHCCVNEKKESNCSITKSSCCEISSTYLKQNFVRHETVTKAFSILHQNYFPYYLFFFSITSAIKISSSFTHPPSLLLQSSAVFTQRFRI